MRRRGSRRGGFGLIEMVIVIVIIALLVGAYFGLTGKFGGKKKSIPGQAVDRAKDVECQSNIRQIRNSIQMKTWAGEPAPASLAEVASELGVGDDFAKCPVGGEAYRYDPQAGTVSCPHAGHESF
ncbi:MAG: prepilin-type N-terminal cleavage/methylation domain-containing protein [Armatimonadota bacterium]